MKVKFGPFEASRIKLGELYKDCIDYLKSVYGNVGDYFTLSSPMGQLLQITLQMGRMILYYIEDSITELNIYTASRPQSIKGLARLTGHNPSRAISARGTLQLSYNGNAHNIKGNIAVIPNYTEVINNINGLSYLIVLNSNETRLNLNSAADNIAVSIIQGSLEYQTATGTGTPLQSYNFQQKVGKSIDNYFTNVYVNGEKWDAVESILDLSFNQKGVLIKTGQTGGLDIYFGNGFNGRIPESGAVITMEYLITDGVSGNMSNMNMNDINSWTFKSNGYTLNSTTIDLNDIINISVKDEILFGTIDEPLYLTRLLAPQTSRSYVLANSANYISFLKKLNMFSIIDAFPGYNTFEDKYAAISLSKAEETLTLEQNNYTSLLKQYGEDSDRTKDQYNILAKAKNVRDYWQTMVNNLKKDDNTVYLFLVPNISNKLSAGENYFNVSDDIFILSENEKSAILNLIEESGQRVLTVDNIILTPKYVNFATNVYLIVWENYDIDTIKNNIVSKLSEYFINNTRRDRIPVSDITKIIEDLDGVDSVTVNFEADKSNISIYNNHYGIDDYGDIILYRYINDADGNDLEVKDIYPLFRGGFTSQFDVYYDKGYNNNIISALNISVRGITKKNYNSMYNAKIISGL